MFSLPAIPDNYNYLLGFQSSEYHYEVYDVTGLQYTFLFYEYAVLREVVNKATRSGRQLWVVALNYKGQRVFYTNMKRQKSLQPMHWRQCKGA